jgi:hypothetical protein
MELSKSAAALVDEYRREPRVEPLDFARTAAYRQFIEAVEQAGFTGPDIEADREFSDRTPEWVKHADELALRRWVHTLIRADRWNGDFPTAVLKACSGGQLGVLAAKLRASSAD